jgi:NADH-quinone oxidoreductase subunit J
MESLFYIHAVMAVIAMAFAMMIKHTVHALLAFVASLLFLAVSMYILSAPLAAGLLIIVYAGAIMVLFAFAIMLLQIPGPDQAPPEPTNRSSLLMGFLIFCIFWGELSFVMRSGMSEPVLKSQTIKDIAQALFVKYGFLVELSSMLLLAGLASAIYVGANFMTHARRSEVKSR